MTKRNARQKISGGRSSLARRRPGRLVVISDRQRLKPHFRRPFLCSISSHPTLFTGTPVAQGVNQIYFNLFAPSGPKPVQGWPVAIWDPSTNTLYAESDALQAARLAGVQDDNAKASAERPPEVAMREESRSAEPSPSKSMPIWISRTSCSNDSKQLEFRFHDDLLLMRRDS